MKSVGCKVGKQSALQVRRRLVVAPPSFVIKVVDKDGIRKVKDIRAVS